MKIKVLKTTKAASCQAGTSTKVYESGDVYDIHEALANVFLREGWGELETANKEKKEPIKESAKEIEVSIEERSEPKKEKKAPKEKKEQKAMKKLNNKAVTNLDNK